MASTRSLPALPLLALFLPGCLLVDYPDSGPRLSSRYQLEGEREGDNAGAAVAGAGDVDGDGRPDLLVGAYGRDNASGRAYLVLSASMNDNTVALSDADYALSGVEADDNAGRAVAGAGDIDGDGLGDLLVGAPGANAAYVLFGKNLESESDLGRVWADVQLLGAAVDGDAGSSVAGAGDVDGDGRDDVLVGARSSDDFAGKVSLFLGSRLGAAEEVGLPLADYTFVGGQVDGLGEGLGETISSAGDVDGDGRDDLLMSTAFGAPYLVSADRLGSTGSTRPIADIGRAFRGGSEQDGNGIGLAGAGDVDGDGRADLLIGAPLNEDNGFGAGKVYLILAAQLEADGDIDLDEAEVTLIGSEGEVGGDSLASATDMDGDGRADLIVGAPATSNVGNGRGRVYVVLGSRLDAAMTMELADADAIFEYPHAGGMVAGAGDIDGDGLDDLLLGDKYRDPARTGGAYVVLSPF